MGCSEDNYLTFLLPIKGQINVKIKWLNSRRKIDTFPFVRNVCSDLQVAVETVCKWLWMETSSDFWHRRRPLNFTEAKKSTISEILAFKTFQNKTILIIISKLVFTFLKTFCAKFGMFNTKHIELCVTCEPRNLKIIILPTKSNVLAKSKDFGQLYCVIPCTQ